MSAGTASAMAPTEAHAKAEAARAVAKTLRDDIEQRRAIGKLGKYGGLWESAAATCDDVAEFLDEIDKQEKESSNE